MPYVLKWEPSSVAIEFSGDISIHDLEQATSEFQGDRRFDDIRYVIADYARIRSCDARPHEIESVWAMDYGARRSNPKVRKAVVTTRSEVLSLARNYVEHYGSDGFEVRTFATRAEANLWVGAP